MLEYSPFPTAPPRTTLASFQARGSLARIIHQSQKLTEEGALGSRMILQTAVSQERHYPKTSISGCPGTVPTGRMVIIGHNASSQPPQAYRKLFALTPRRSPRRFPGPARLDARTPTRSNCASIPAPPGTTRGTISCANPCTLARGLPV